MRCCFATRRAEVATVGLDNRIALKKVRIARDFGSEVEIAGGLNVDERIVANPPESIEDGEEVRLADASGGSSLPPTGQQRAGAERAKSHRWLGRSGAAANEAAVLARRVDRVRARRMRLRASIRPAADVSCRPNSRTRRRAASSCRPTSRGGAASRTAPSTISKRKWTRPIPTLPRRSRPTTPRPPGRRKRRRGFSRRSTAIGQITANRQSNNRPTRGANQPDYYGNNILGGQVSYEIDIWGRVRDLVEAANLTAEASADALAEARLELHAELARAYVDLRGLDAQAKLISDTIGIYRSALDLTKSRLQAQIASPVDVDRAQTQLSSAEAQGSEIALQRAALENAIAALVGKPAASFSVAKASARSSAAEAAARRPGRGVAAEAGRRRTGTPDRRRQSGRRRRAGEFLPAVYSDSVGWNTGYGFPVVQSGKYLRDHRSVDGFPVVRRRSPAGGTRGGQGPIHRGGRTIPVDCAARRQGGRRQSLRIALACGRVSADLDRRRGGPQGGRPLDDALSRRSRHRSWTW